MGIEPITQRRILLSLFVAAGFWLLRRIVLKVVRGSVENPRALYQWGKVSSYVASGLALLIIGSIWLEGIGSIGTFLGLLSAGLAIALREPVANLAAWGFILWRRPFEVGDRISIGQVAGDVVDIGLFQFSILEIGNWVDADQSTGRVIEVPNARLFSTPLANSTAEFPYIWHEVPVLITFESDWRVAREIVKAAVEDIGSAPAGEVREHMKRANEKYLISYRHITPIVYLTVKDSGVLLTARYLCDPRARRGTAQGIWIRILDEFAQRDDVELAYPTYRITAGGDDVAPRARSAGEKDPT
ncbi:MAG: mechanosensitive ion channel family protein [Gemmatimonadetes bacterium]|nr:mechanosensitive ion channel family protein [Gemmatimonadota bacterium]NNM31979.1 mechanosensitive ion channel family protein [Gemmatimonadota bacterium]